MMFMRRDSSTKFLLQKYYIKRYIEKNREKSWHDIIGSHIVLREEKKKSSKMICT